MRSIGVTGMAALSGRCGLFVSYRTIFANRAHSAVRAKSGREGEQVGEQGAWNDTTAMTAIGANGRDAASARAWVYQQYARKLGHMAGVAFKGRADTADIEDALHDVFMRVFASTGEFRGEARLLTYLYRAVVNQLLTGRRGVKAHPSFSLDDEDTADALIAEIDRTLGSGASPEGALSAKQVQDCVRGAIETLRQRSGWAVGALWLWYVERVPQDEIAEILDRTYEATRTGISKWTKVMHGLLEPCMEMRDN